MSPPDWKACDGSDATTFLAGQCCWRRVHAATPPVWRHGVGATDSARVAPPKGIPKYVTPLVIPPEMPWTSRGRVDYYEIAVRQFRQQILPAGLPATTVWGYGSVNHPGTFNYPAFTIEADYHRPVRIKWINGLVDRHGDFLPHLLPVDPTLHWANPPGGTRVAIPEPTFTETPLGRTTGRFRS